MLSRVAESVYWMSRYSERAENVARFVDVNYNLTLGEASTLGEQWSPLVYTTGDHQDFEERYDAPTRENVLKFLLFDKENPNSILSCVSNARESARTIREVLPEAVWEQVNRFYLMVREASKSGDAINQPFDFCEAIRMASHLMIGITHSSMRRDEAWYFMHVGRYIERADKTSRIADVQYFLLLPNSQDVGTSIDVVRWSSLLKSADALGMYRRTHGRIATSKVADFLLLDPVFPRSIRFCVSRAQSCLATMTGEANGFSGHSSVDSASPADSMSSGDLPSEELAKQLTDRLSSVTIDEIIQQGMHSFIDQLQGALNGIGTAIRGDFFDTQVQQLRSIETASMNGMSQKQG